MRYSAFRYTWKDDIFGYIFLLGVVVGCGFLFVKCVETNPLPDKKVEVDRVFMNEAHQYTFYVASEEGVFFQPVTYDDGYLNRKPVRIFADVPEGEKSWILLKGETSFIDGNRFKIVEIHVHDLKVLEGGGWNHGKFGQGQTIPIE
ncbi:MAG: hypothetical protein UU48_C0014G0001 [Candidatus Uhrbacteria bacterium GW2011_GWF2_41_16]|uniref:Uncharacterized protein n=1 Tax=Candidatus Uhrbacteria bacterium GW2011_GWF2_41_16 TaxID=1618997 RepID=A0A0G0V8U9_9BACT|nr:MAG: hypothetical protein UU31_C0009G0002 [Candidatus Uhrbacteria bacterium GW2011_GWA2_41_10]KKR97468.1 MAG: hypothetical protein UU48_C0014G0001 [Candidatus Uhrbacteria bacterium GW2011_GWF2_41_16]